MKQLTFLGSDATPAKGPYTFARLRKLWSAGKIVADSKLFLTESDEADKVKCFGLRAADIKEILETGNEIDVDSVSARVGGETGFCRVEGEYENYRNDKATY